MAVHLRNNVSWSWWGWAELLLQLHEVLLAEQSYIMLKQVVECKNLDEAMITIEKALPCILNLENIISKHWLGGFSIEEWAYDMGAVLNWATEKDCNIWCTRLSFKLVIPKLESIVGSVLNCVTDSVDIFSRSRREGSVKKCTFFICVNNKVLY